MELQLTRAHTSPASWRGTHTTSISFGKGFSTREFEKIFLAAITTIYSSSAEFYTAKYVFWSIRFVTILQTRLKLGAVEVCISAMLNAVDVN